MGALLGGGGVVAGEDGGERADGFEAQDATGLDRGFVDAGDG